MQSQGNWGNFGETTGEVGKSTLK